jgi:stage II sporulation protein R
MKKNCISFLIFLILIVSAIAISLPKAEYKEEYLRIHIRANSSCEQDQEVKYKVKDEVVKFLTPKLFECTTKEKAQKIISANEKEIEMKMANAIKH